MKRFSVILVLMLILSASLFLSVGAQEEKKDAAPADEKVKKEETIKVLLQGVTLGALLEHLSTVMKKPVIPMKTTPLDQPITVMGKEKDITIRKDRYIGFIKMLLSSYNMDLDVRNDFIRVVESKYVPPTVVERLPEDPPYEQVVFVYRFSKVDSKAIGNALFKLARERDAYYPLEFSQMHEANSIVVKGNSFDVAKIQRVIEFLDQEVPTENIITEQFKLQFYNPKQVDVLLRNFVQKLTTPSTGSGGAARSINLSAQHKIEYIIDERSAIIFFIGYKHSIAEAMTFVKSIDLKIEDEKRRRMYELKNAQADVLEPIMKTLFSTPPPGAGGAPVPTNMNSRPPVIVAVKQNNALLVDASPEDHDEIAKMIEMLDKEKYQVFVEAYIVEMSHEKAFEIGSELATLDDPGANIRGFGGTFMGLSSLDATVGRVPVPPSGGLMSGLWRNAAGSIPFLLSMSASEGDVDVLATPFILAYDNEEATIERRQEIPYEQQIIDSNGRVIGTPSGFYEAKIQLKITPHISSADHLNLKISQTVEQFFRSPFTDRPAKNSNSATTYVSVPNGKTLSIGGLTRVSDEKTVNKVPFFGDIPLLKWLFRKQNNNNNKSALYIFITPHIIKDFSDLEKLTKEHKKALEAMKLGRDKWYKKSKSKSKSKTDKK